MSTSAAARRYARALFMIGKEDRSVGELRSELDALASRETTPALLAFAAAANLFPVARKTSVDHPIGLVAT